MAAPAYFTFAPGKAPAGKQGQQIKLAPGEHLAYKPGAGYYAKTTPVAPSPGPAEPKSFQSPNGPYAPQVKAVAKTAGGGKRVVVPPVDPFAARSAADIDARAAAQAQAGLTPQQEELRRQQALAAAGATADEQAIQGFQTAAGGLLAGIAPTVGAGYQAAAATEGDVGTKVAGQVGADLQGKTAADLTFEATQGQQGGAPTVDPTGVESTLGYVNGAIPADSLAQQGAAQEALAAKAVQIPLDAGREQIDARMAQARQDQDGYAQQLIKIAEQFPGLKAQALQQLNQYEVDKANYRQTVRMNTQAIVNQKADNARQDRAELANEAALGINTKVKQDESNYRWASLDFKNKQEAARAQAQAAKGKTIDTAASKLLGHIVYKDGSEDPSIKVKQTTATNPQQKAAVNRAKATSAARKAGYDYAVKIAGKPTVNKNQGVLGGPGKYIADPSEKYGVPGGVFPPVGKNGVATTNDPSRAARTGGIASNYADAQTKVWAEIDGDGLMSRYGYSRPQVMAIVNTALARAGWKKK